LAFLAGHSYRTRPALPAPQQHRTAALHEERFVGSVTRKIGLSLGADLCWPLCFEDLAAELDLSIPIGSDTVRFEIERVTIEPFSLRKPAKYDVVLDRLTHWYSTSREWIKKAVLMDGVYVLNNPWSVQSMEKQSSYCAMMDLGFPIPDTWLLPPKEYESSPDLQPTLDAYAKLFDLGEIGKAVGYPMYMKPYDGGGWVGVSRADDEDQLRKAYEESGKFVMHVQKGVEPHDRFVRCVGVGPQVRIVNYDPGAPLHQRYQPDRDFVSPEVQRMLEDTTLTINAFFGWDFNSCEMLHQNGIWHPIDFANPCPDSQVTSLNVHFPWLVLSKLRWALFCAATKRKMHTNLDWEPFYKIRDKGLDLPDRIAEYGKHARAHFDVAHFEDFCGEHLADLDKIAYDYFASDRARDAVRRKVEALFPEHEWEEFAQYFWDRIGEWREYEGKPAAELSKKPIEIPAKKAVKKAVKKKKAKVAAKTGKKAKKKS
jgi:hypothetical protein